MLLLIYRQLHCSANWNQYSIGCNKCVFIDSIFLIPICLWCWQSMTKIYLSEIWQINVERPTSIFLTCIRLLFNLWPSFNFHFWNGNSLSVLSIRYLFILKRIVRVYINYLTSFSLSIVKIQMCNGVWGLGRIGAPGYRAHRSVAMAPMFKGIRFGRHHFCSKVWEVVS